MAVELFVMPLSRYWAGDFVSEAMRVAWSLGAPYVAVTADGQVVRTHGDTFGGRGSGARRADLQTAMQAFFDSVPSGEKGRRLWDEGSDVVVTGHQMSHDALRTLEHEARAVLEGGQARWKRLLGLGRRSHLGYSSYFLPVRFDSPYTKGGWRIGSLWALSLELAQLTPSQDTSDAHEAFLEAARAATKHRLPLIVDS